MANEASLLQTLTLFLIMSLVTLWFTNIIIRGLDLLYRPKLKTWIQDKPYYEEKSEIEFSDEFMEELEKELLVLKALRGKDKPRKRIDGSKIKKEEDIDEFCHDSKSNIFGFDTEEVCHVNSNNVILN